jgi:dTDP-4-amino-4,6-dideoxygalactose transaminase
MTARREVVSTSGAAKVTGGRPAILGGTPAFPDGLQLVRPTLPDPEAVARDVRTILDSRVLTNGPFAERLEERAAAYLGIRHCVSVASCTLGLMLALRILGLRGSVVVPSFTFAATVHAVAWNGLTPAFADIDRATLTLDPASAKAAVDDGAAAILATHTFGTPCDVEALESVARDRGVALVFDAAHALGSRHGGTPVGSFGRAEVFSLTPTKLVVAGEGGIVATDDDDLAEACRIGREYGNPGDYDSRFVGLNARMSEFHAAVALRSLEGLDERVRGRNDLAAVYRRSLGDLAGISFPTVPQGDLSTYKDFTVLVEGPELGLDAPCLARALAAEGVATRRYYAPPVHVHQAYREATPPDLPATDWAAARVLTLPLWSDMSDQQVEGVAEAIRRIVRYPDVAAACEGA